MKLLATFVIVGVIVGLGAHARLAAHAQAPAAAVSLFR